VKLSTDHENSFRAIITKNQDDGSNNKFTKIVDQMYFDESFHYDWPFMLERWIEAWKSGFRHSSSIIVPEFQKDNNSSNKLILSFEQKLDDNTKRKRPSKKNSNNHKKSWQKANLKCHYCGLTFVNKSGREDHGREWHAVKYGKSQ